MAKIIDWNEEEEKFEFISLSQQEIHDILNESIREILEVSKRGEDYEDL